MVTRDSSILCDVLLDRSLCNFPIPSIMPMRWMEDDTLYYEIIRQILLIMVWELSHACFVGFIIFCSEGIE